MSARMVKPILFPFRGGPFDISSLVRAVDAEQAVRDVVFVAARDQADDLGASHDHVRARLERAYQSSFDSVLERRERAAHGRRKGVDFFFALLSGLDSELLAALARAGEEAYSYAEPALGAPEWGDLAERAEAFAGQRAPLLAGVPGEVAARLREALEPAVRAGESPLALARRLAEAVRDVEESEGGRVAATEAQATYGTAMDAVLKAAGLTHKRWVSQRDERVRESHVLCDQQGAIPVGQVFQNGLRFPGDPNGPAEEVINCRCNLFPERREPVKATDASQKFGCLMALVPAAEAAAIVAWAALAIRDEDVNAVDGTGREDQPHATVLFGFNADFDPELLEALDDFGPVRFELGKLTRFENKEKGYDVLKFDVVSSDLKRLNAAVASDFSDSVTPSKWDYKPHVTVAYVRHGSAKELDGDNLFTGARFSISRLLYKGPPGPGRVVKEVAL